MRSSRTFWPICVFGHVHRWILSIVLLRGVLTSSADFSIWFFVLSFFVDFGLLEFKRLSEESFDWESGAVLLASFLLRDMMTIRGGIRLRNANKQDLVGNMRK